MMRWATFALAFAAASGSTVSMQKLLPSRGGGAGGVGGATAGQVVDAGLGTTQLFDTNSVWVDLDQSTWQRAPDWLKGITALLPASKVSADKQVLWECTDASQTGIPFCEMHAYAYPCIACPDFEHGDFITKMTNLGWEMYRCAPWVRVVPGGVDHAMVGFTKRLAAGTSYTLLFDAPETEFTVYAIDHNPDACSAHGDEASCLSPARGGKCGWNGSTCSLQTCRPNPIGPNNNPPCTNHCITDDVPPGVLTP